MRGSQPFSGLQSLDSLCCGFGAGELGRQRHLVLQPKIIQICYLIRLPGAVPVQEVHWWGHVTLLALLASLIDFNPFLADGGMWLRPMPPSTFGMQQKFRGAMRKPDCSSTSFRTATGHSAPLRPGSVEHGTWTGVLQFSDTPMRKVELPWPPDVYESGRTLVTMGLLGGFNVLQATVYLPPPGPTFPRARALAEKILAPLSEEIVLGRQGIRIIGGDFNHPPSSLKAMQCWESLGWKELQTLMQERYGIAPTSTCKGASRSDQLWLSPEAQEYVSNIGFADVFSDHLVMIMQLNLPSMLTYEWVWPQPQPIPWDAVDRDRFDLLYSSRKPTTWQGDLTDELHAWSSSFESLAIQTMHDTSHQLSRYEGRCAVLEPKKRLTTLKVPKASRPGEEMISSSLLGRSVQLWFQQLRRFQSLRANLKKGSDTFEASLYRQQVWQSIRKAKGYRTSFVQWWHSRPQKLQGSPDHLPEWPPELATLNQIYEDYHQNYRSYEAWNQAQRAKSLRNRLDAAFDRTFQLVKSDYKAPLETLVDSHESIISIIDASQGLVKVDFPIPSQNIMNWTLNGVPALVTPQGEALHVESDLLLAPGQTLGCKVLIQDLDEIHSRLRDLWLPRWNRHANTPPEQWDRIVRFCEAFLPRGHFSMPHWTFEDWIHTVKHFKAKTSSGPDGWSRSDLMHTPPNAGMEIVNLYNHIESTAAWPRQWTQALVKCLEKKPDSTTANGFRPITLFSIHYRAWASHRSRQCLRHLHKFSDDLQCGYAEDHEASDIWFHIQTMVEVGLLLGEGVHGVVGDLVKAFNLIPRAPCWLMMRLLGLPDSLLDCWKTFLAMLERRFMVRNSCGPVLMSVAGFAEGCPMSCTAMCALDVAWHHYQRKFSHLTRPLSFVDNLEIVSHNAGATLHGLGILREWCSIVDMQLDEKQLYAWSTTSAGRALFRASNLNVAYSGRDLGGQCKYGANLHNDVLVARLKGIDPFFQILRRSSKSVAQKRLCITGALFPRGLHGCEAVSLGAQHLTHCGAGVMKALHWDRAGASQVIRLGILNVNTLDPGYYQFLRCLLLFRRQCWRFPGLRQKWVTFLLHRHVRDTPGPFSKLYEQLLQVHWTQDGDMMLWIHDRISIPYLSCSISLLKIVSMQAWANFKTEQIRTRAGYQDLAGVDLGSLNFVDSHFTPFQCELLNIVRDGSFFTGSRLSKYDNTVSSTCILCGELDSPEHRYLRCPRYEAVRMQSRQILANWHDLPECARLHGLMPGNPYQSLAWQALHSLEAVSENVEQIHYAGSLLNVFIDGTCSQPKHPEIALAAWAFQAVELSEVCHSGPVPGFCQTSMRAELYSLLQVLPCSRGYPGETHVWCDCQSVVEGLRLLQHNEYVPHIWNTWIYGRPSWMNSDFDKVHCGFTRLSPMVRQRIWNTL